VHKAFLYNVTDGTYVGIGSNESCAGTGGQASNSVFSGQIAFAGSKNFTIRHYTSTVLASIGLGQACTTGQSEVYAELEFEKVA
jgi:hypothetical protein